jgi:hypothetical protein
MVEDIYRVDEDGNIVKGIGIPAFCYKKKYHSILIKIYENGVIDCGGKLDFVEFSDKVRNGWIFSSEVLETKGRSLVGKPIDIDTYKDEEMFISEVEDILIKLKAKCRLFNESCMLTV